MNEDCGAHEGWPVAFCRCCLDEVRAEGEKAGWEAAVAKAAARIAKLDGLLRDPRIEQFGDAFAAWTQDRDAVLSSQEKP